LTEFGDKIDASEKSKIEEGVAALKKAMEGDDPDAIKSAEESLMQASHKLAEAVYAKTQGASPEGGAAEAGEKPKDEKVVDADFEEVKDK
jgi:molecular chaperone DnaK